VFMLLGAHVVIHLGLTVRLTDRRHNQPPR